MSLLFNMLSGFVIAYVLYKNVTNINVFPCKFHNLSVYLLLSSCFLGRIRMKKKRKPILVSSIFLIAIVLSPLFISLNPHPLMRETHWPVIY